MPNEKTLRLERDTYIHVLDHLTQLTKVHQGPATFVRKDSEEILSGPNKNLQLPPNSYTIIENPVELGTDGKPLKDEYGCYKLTFGDREVRLSEDWQDSFPLYPGEKDIFNGVMQKLVVVTKDEDILIEVTQTYTTAKGVERQAGSRYQLHGPKTYTPRKEENFVSRVERIIVKPNTALRLEALSSFTDRSGVKRVQGEMWQYYEVGSFLPGVNEKVERVVKGYVLTDKSAIHVQASHDYTDQFGVMRRPAEQWLVTNDMKATYIPDVHEVVMKKVNSITLSNREWVKVDSPYCKVEKRIRRGQSEIRFGELTFFQVPGEEIGAKQSLQVLSAEQSMVLQAIQPYTDENGVNRKPGEKWLKSGPGEYHPSTKVQVLDTRFDLALDSTEGVYVRDTNTGEVRSVIGQNVTLSADEELWDKHLSPQLSQLLNRKHDVAASRVVSYACGENEAVQIFDYKSNQQRVVFGPELIMLAPNEEFKVLNLSAGVPKMENGEKRIAINLGQNHFDDEITVETQDHAVLNMKLSYSGSFLIDDAVRKNPDRIFSVHDYIGITCKTVASRIRGAVSSIAYNDFHSKNASFVKNAIFGNKAECFFPENNFMLNQCDVKQIEPADLDIRENLKKTNAKSLELKTKATELEYNLLAQQQEEQSRGELEVRALSDKTEAAQKRVELDIMQVQSKKIEMSGAEKAKAEAQRESNRITGESKLIQSESLGQSYKIETQSLVKSMKMQNTRIEDTTREADNMEINTVKKLKDIEVKRFQLLVGSLGVDTIVDMARSGPKQKAEMLKNLGLEGYLVTDGATPINLFGAAEGLLKTE